MTFIFIMMIRSPFMGLGRFFIFLILYTAGMTSWTGDQSVARPLFTHNATRTQDIHASSGIRTHDLSVWTGENSSCLRPRGYCDRYRSNLNLMSICNGLSKHGEGSLVLTDHSGFTPFQQGHHCPKPSAFIYWQVEMLPVGSDRIFVLACTWLTR
jgi:hypothetical protein